MFKKRCFIILSLMVLVGVESSICQGTQLLRQPTIHNGNVVFVYANDLWKSNINGKAAIRLTTNEGYETNPHYSNDGKWIAFTAEYNGNFDVFVIPSKGGEPLQLTWHPGGDFVQGWLPDNKVVFRSGRNGHPTGTNQFFSVELKGGLPTKLDIPRAAYGEVNADGTHVAYTPITSWDPEWRNYRGGQAMPIWILNMQSKELVRTPQKDKERHLDPIWLGEEVFYLSERDYASNIWSFNSSTLEETQHTFHKKFDVKSLDSDGDIIVYECGGYLHSYDPESKESKQLNIDVKGDMNYARERWMNVKPTQLTNPYISPNGERVLFESRGEILSFPKEDGSWRNLTKSSGSAERSPSWSPKGDKIAWFSDESGEYQLIIADQYGKKIKTISIPDATFYFKPQWSPDGTFLAFGDTHYNLKIVNTNTGFLSHVDTDRYAHPVRTLNAVWSPDSKWIAYPRQLDNHFKAIFAYNILSKEKIQITDGMSDAISPVWDQNGEYLYFLASTDYGLNSGWLDMSSYDPSLTRSLYAVVLSDSGKSPNLPRSDEEREKDEDESKSEDKVTVDLDSRNIQKRIVTLELEADDYTGLVAGPKNHVFIVKSEEKGNSVLDYDVSKEKSEVHAEGINFSISNYDGSYLLMRKGNQWVLSESSSKPDFSKDELNTSAKIKVHPKEEYHQIFKESWRFMRDFLYVDNIHGAPWDKIYEWYSPWIDHVRNRRDLNYVVDILSGEVAIGHSYVYGGDNVNVEDTDIGLLGCDYTIMGDHYAISKIYTSQNWNPDVKAPLYNPGLDVREGDYILAIQGVPLTAKDNIYKHLEQTANREITLTLSKSNGVDKRDILVKPITSEQSLRTIDWVESNRKKVNEMSEGKLAYVYVPNTAARGFNSFNRYYFSQQDKKGVIIDERNNGGGSAADYMIDVLSREIFGYFNSKAGDKRPWTTPISGIWGPKVMLINERSGSGGDLFPYMFKAKNLGPLIGTRTWGGLVGTWDTPRFIDGGRMVAPRGGFFDRDGNWAVEGDGISPDIEIIQHPKMMADGNDPQLERGVQEALKLLEGNEFQLKEEPAPPIKWKRPTGFEIKDH